ncbi:Hypothetical protein LUCI_0707 [Lucifera butyrica]|uniref:DUF2993 domain-containing protein n=1 Tax=Lucifera butyrica TaxID=1351585 RepID=A0A498R3R4_9FIRM|nr:DUF2993 domain-containing protein [Lucifera butyrica]VBB05497.1 Hypothetical protein LUCI_0707 [Lucifera butyrica]
MWKRPILIVAGFLAVLAVVSQLILPSVVAKMVAHGMTQAVGSEQVAVDVKTVPAAAMLAGRFDKIVVKANQAKVDKMTFSELEAVLQKAQLDMNTLLMQRKVQFVSVQNADLKATVTADELARYLNQNVKGIRNAVVTVADGKVKVSTTYSLVGIASVAITLEGKIAAKGQKLEFVTDRFLLNNVLVGNIGGGLLTNISLVDLKKLPFGVSVRDVVMDQGKITIFADNLSR